jgi:hypothetical protein
MSRHFKTFKIGRTDSGYNVEFLNKDTGQQITMSIPLSGIFEGDPSREITRNEVKNIATAVSDVLDKHLV